MAYTEHHTASIRRAGDALAETIVCLESGLMRMQNDDAIDVYMLIDAIKRDIQPVLSRLRANAFDRFNEHTRHPDFQKWLYGEEPFPDERPLEEPSAPPRAPASGPTIQPPPLNGPNIRRAEALVAKHGGLDEALKAYPPATTEHDDLRAYQYVTTGKRPQGWIPPIANP